MQKKLDNEKRNKCISSKRDMTLVKIPEMAVNGKGIAVILPALEENTRHAGGFAEAPIIFTFWINIRR
jgi:hypothetical protein